MLAYRMPQVEMAGFAGTEADVEGDALSSSEIQGDLVTGEETGLSGVGLGQPSTIREASREERGNRVVENAEGAVVATQLTLRPGYQYRMANWEIGRAAERAKEREKLSPFKPGDRFLAWRKKQVRIAKNAERRGMRNRGGKKKART